MSQTQQFVIRVNTYGPSWLDEQNQMPRYVDGVTRADDRQVRGQLRGERGRSRRRRSPSRATAARPRSIAVGVASMDQDSATVLVGFVRTDSYPKPGDPNKRLKLPGNPERWAVQLVRTQGEWLVDNYAVISEIPEGAAPSRLPVAQRGRPAVSLSLYDVLDVEPDATAEEIRAAWKGAIADLGPGDRRFRAYNDAAEVLLDPERRAATTPRSRARRRASGSHRSPSRTPSRRRSGPDPEPEPEPEPGPEPEPEPEPEPDPSPPPRRSRHAILTWLLAAVGLPRPWCSR